MRYRKLIVDREKCDGCGRCCCPFGALELREGVLYHNAALCREDCRACALLCEKDAIELAIWECGSSCAACDTCNKCGRRP